MGEVRGRGRKKEQKGEREREREKRSQIKGDSRNREVNGMICHLFVLS